MDTELDVLVVGGGPAGLAAAIAARRAGFRVLVADSRTPPIDKSCGEGLMPDALEAASELGIEIPASIGVPFRGIRFVGRAHQVAAHFPDGAGLGVRRVALHDLLYRHAQSVGVDFSWGAPVAGFAADSVSIGGARVTARWIIGADGTQSATRRAAGLDNPRPQRDRALRFGFRRHYAIAPWSDHMELHWGDGCQFYITPVSANEVCVVTMSRDPHRRVLDTLPDFPHLAERLRVAPAASEERGAISSTCRLRRVTRGRFALIGDASGRVDSITGDGICLAFRQSAALARALSAGDLRQYEVDHRRLTRRPMLMGDFMLLIERQGFLQDRTLRAFEARPALFQNLLAMHVGKLGLFDFAKTGLALGWKVATV